MVKIYKWQSGSRGLILCDFMASTIYTVKKEKIIFFRGRAPGVGVKTGFLYIVMGVLEPNL